MKSLLFLLMLLALILSPIQSFGSSQSDDISIESLTNSAIGSAKKNSSTKIEDQNRRNLYLLFFISMVIVFIFSIAMVMMRREKITNPNAYVTICGLHLIVFSILIVPIIIKSDNTAAFSATFGIVGTIAGYLFGRSDQGDDQRTRILEEKLASFAVQPVNRQRKQRKPEYPIHSLPNQSRAAEHDAASGD